MDPDQTTTWAFDNVHTAQNPYCQDLSCSCHYASEYHELVIEPLTIDGDIVAAYSFFGLVEQQT